MTGYRHILVPLDGSSLAAQALPHAHAIALRARARVSLAPEPGRLTTGAVPTQRLVADEQIQAIQEQWRQYAYDALHAQVQAFAEAGIDAGAAVEIGPAAETIMGYAQDQAVDLIIMGSHGRSGVSRWLHGSVAEQVLHAGPCPVLLVRATEGQPVARGK